MADTAINTFSGGRLDFADPQPKSIKLGDIAHGLSFVPRFGAQALVFRSVAQHAVFVSEIVERLGHRELALAGLHHDSHEAYACDIPSPLKGLLGGPYRKLTDKLDAAIFTALGLDQPTEGSMEAELIKTADRAALKVEAESPLKGDQPHREVDPQALDCARQVYAKDHWPSDKAKEAFLHRAEELG